MNLQPPPQTNDIDDLRRWCEEVHRFLQYPTFHQIKFVPRATCSGTDEGNVYYDSDTDKLTLRVAAAWETITSA